MIVTCEECGKTYDDVDHRTYCPHPYFEMQVVAGKSSGETKICTNLRELDEFFGWNR